MKATEAMELQTIIKGLYYDGKRCMFKFHYVEKQYVKKCLLFLADDKSPGIDNLDGKLLRTAARHISSQVCHIFSKCLEHGVCVQRSGKRQK